MKSENNEKVKGKREKRTIKNETFFLKKPGKKRSKIMSMIRSRNTSVEIVFAKLLRDNKIRYRRPKNVVGKPDFVLFGYKIAIFCDGDFWHGYNFEQIKIKRNKEFWIAKIKRNMERDKEVNMQLKLSGWMVIRFWEHDIKNDSNKCIRKVLRSLKKAEDNH